MKYDSIHSPFIITVTGPSQSGKSTVLDKIEKLAKRLKNEGYRFVPARVTKETTRSLRVEEMIALDRGEVIDVKNVEKISEECDLVYQTYGIRYGLSTDFLRRLLEEGKSPFVVVNDIRAVEELKKVFPNKVLALFLFRKMPDIVDFEKVSGDRGNVAPEESKKRYEKAIAIYRMYIENIALFDRVILNAIEYAKEGNVRRQNIIDEQLYRVVKGVLDGEILLRQKSSTLHSDVPKTFIIAGNSASGKDEIVRAIQSMGKLDAKILPKFTTRKQQKGDETEMICRLVPNANVLKEYDVAYETDKTRVIKSLSALDKDVRTRFRKQWAEMQTRIVDSIETGTDRFWREVAEKEKTNEINNYFEPNVDYVDLEDVEKNGKICELDENDGTAIREYLGEKFITYRGNGKLYGFKVKETKVGGKFHVVVASNLGVFNLMKKELGVNNVVVIYAHSQISGKKVADFDRLLQSYVDNIVKYDHVAIFAQSLREENKSMEEEELIDQMFRLFRVY